MCTQNCSVKHLLISYISFFQILYKQLQPYFLDISSYFSCVKGVPRLLKQTIFFTCSNTNKGYIFIHFSTYYFIRLSPCYAVHHPPQDVISPPPPATVGCVTADGQIGFYVGRA